MFNTNNPNGMNNPILMQQLMSQYPQIMSLLSSTNQTPEQLCRTICQQQGIDINAVLQQAQQILGMRIK